MMKTFTHCMLVGLLAVGQRVHAMAQEGSAVATDVASDTAIAVYYATATLRHEMVRLGETTKPPNFAVVCNSPSNLLTVRFDGT